jgi:hypothetical protein
MMAGGAMIIMVGGGDHGAAAPIAAASPDTGPTDVEITNQIFFDRDSLKRGYESN